MSPTVHAGAVALGEDGLLIRGAPGSGKSAFARALLALWTAEGLFAALVADDRTALSAAHGALIARPPQALAGRIEVRGVGIVAVPTLAAVRLTLVADLEAAPERLPAPDERCVSLLGVTLPRLVFPGCTAEHSAVTLKWLLQSRALTQLDGEAQRVDGETATV